MKPDLLLRFILSVGLVLSVGTNLEIEVKVMYVQEPIYLSTREFEACYNHSDSFP